MYIKDIINDILSDIKIVNDIKMIWIWYYEMWKRYNNLIEKKILLDKLVYNFKVFKLWMLIFWL